MKRSALPAGSDGPAFRRRSLLLLLFLALATVLTFDPKPYVSGDNADYLLLTQRIIREGDLWASPKFPPFFPMLLVPVQLLFGIGWLAPKLFVMACYVAAGPLLLRLYERVLPPRWSLCAAAVSLLVTPLLEFSHYVMSEIPFFLLTLVALLLGERALEALARRTKESGASEAPQIKPPQGSAREQWGQWRHRMHGTLTDILLFVAAGALAFYTRTIGAVLIAALALTLLLRRNWRWFAAAVALGFLIAAPWLLHARQTRTEGSSYLTQLLSADPYAIDTAGQATALDLGGRLLANASVYFGRDIPLGVFPYLFTGTYSGDPRLEPTVPWSIWIPITLLLVLGAIRAARRIPLTVGYLAFTMIILLLWPSVWASPRFLLPILPLLFMCVFLGLSSIAQLFGSRARPIVLGLLLALVGFFGIRNAVTLAGSGQAYPGAWAVYFEGASWAGRNLPRESLVIDRKPSLFTVTSGLPATAFPHEPDVDRMLEHFRERGVDYVHVAMISHGDLSEYLFPVVQQRREAFRAVWHREESQAGRRQLRGALFEFVPSGTGGD